MSYIYSSVIFVNMKRFAFYFAVPSTSSGRKKGRSSTLIQVAVKKLTLSEECLDGKLELGIPWDPLATSTAKMGNCQKNLQSLSLWCREKEEQGGPLDHHDALLYSKEAFHKTSIHGEDLVYIGCYCYIFQDKPDRIFYYVQS